MTSIYIIDADGKKVIVDVTDEVAEADTQTRRAAWRNESKERYHRDTKLIELNDRDEQLGCDTSNPETILLVAEEQTERRGKLVAGLKSLTTEQLCLVKMLKQGMSVTEIAEKLGVDKSAISHRRKRIQEKIKNFLK